MTSDNNQQRKQIVSSLFLIMFIICLTSITGITNSANIVDIRLSGDCGLKPDDTIYINADHEFVFYIENDVQLGAIQLPFRIYSPDGVVWQWTDVGGYGPAGPGTGKACVTVAEGCRMDPPAEIWDMGGLLAYEQNMDEMLSDTIILGGVALNGGLEPGPLEPMMSMHFTASSSGENEIGTLCIDSAFVPPNKDFIFANSTGATQKPSIQRPICWPVRELDFCKPSYGTTVITHGYIPDLGDYDDGLKDDAGWTISMAEAIVGRLAAGKVYTIVDGNIFNFPIEGDYSEDGEKVIVFDWIEESNRPVFGLAEAAADVLFANLIEGAQKGKWSLEQLHFIGHSRGAVVNSEVIQRLGYFANRDGFTLQIDQGIHMTTLDPHPWEDDLFDCISQNFLTGASADDYKVNSGIEAATGEPGAGDFPQAVVCWENVGYADNYHQGECHELHFWPNGLHSYIGLSNNYEANVNLYDGILGSPDIWSGWPPGINHSAVHAWYYGTIRHRSGHDGDGMEIDPAIYYPYDHDYFLGFNIGRNYPLSFINALSVSGRIPVSNDGSLWIGNIFNGDFSMTEGVNSKLPGWTFQGGGGTGHINWGYLELDQENETRTHNKFYVPKTATHLAFGYRVPNKDWHIINPQSDSLDILINFNKVDVITLGEYQKAWKMKKIDVSSYQGKTVILKFDLRDYDGNGIDSEIWIDNVHFFINNFSPLAQYYVASPVDIEIISPSGEFLSRDSVGISFASYDRYELEPGDTGATITIPNPEIGTYQINVIPHANTTPDDEYSVYSNAGGQEIIFADNEKIENIPEEGYQYYQAPDYICGDANGDSNVDIGDAVFIINHVFKGGPSPEPIEAGNANCDNNTDVGDAVYLINHVFKGGPGPCELCD